MRFVAVIVLLPRCVWARASASDVNSVLFQAPVPEVAIEALDKAVLHRLAGLDVMSVDADLLAPLRTALLVSSMPLSEATCLIPCFDDAVFSVEWKEALWDRFYMGAPQRLRRSWMLICE